MKKFILLIAVSLISVSCFAQEVVTSYDEKSLPILNEELRKLSEKNRLLSSENDSLSTRIDAISFTQIGFGAWVDKSADYGAQQATTDGFVVVSVNMVAANNYTYGFTDGNANPTTKRCSIYITDGNSSTTHYTFTMPVRKNDYWKITTVGSIVSVYWLPLGS